MMNTDKLELQDGIMPMIEGVYTYACETILIVVIILFVMY